MVILLFLLLFVCLYLCVCVFRWCFSRYLLRTISITRRFDRATRKRNNNNNNILKHHPNGFRFPPDARPPPLLLFPFPYRHGGGCALADRNGRPDPRRRRRKICIHAVFTTYVQCVLVYVHVGPVSEIDRTGPLRNRTIRRLRRRLGARLRETG